MTEESISEKAPNGFGMELHASGDPTTLLTTYNRL